MPCHPKPIIFIEMRSSLETLEFTRLKQILEKYTQTRYGKKALKALRPEFSLEKAKREFDLLRQFYDFFSKYGLYTLDDIYISDTIKEAFSGPLSEKELREIGNFLEMIKSIEFFFKDQTDERLLEILNFAPLEDLLERINETVDEHGIIKDSATPYLEEVRSQIRTLKENIARHLKESMRSRLKEVIMDTAIFMKRSRYTLLLKPNFREYAGGRVIDISKSGGMFVELDSVYEMNNRLEELILKEEAEIRRILSRVTAMVRRYAQRLKHNEQRVAFLDMQMAKFSYIKEYELPEIKFVNRPVLFAKEAKHPVLAHIKGNQTKSSDIDLKQQRHLIITGPNTGGKTVFLKTAGLLVLSIFSGIPPIASYIEIGPIDSVFSVIGDEQSITESLSSFSAKIAALKEIYANISEHSLVLLDEIGSGTSPDEGEAVAYSVIKNLTGKCMFIATTHYKRLAHILASEDYPTAAFEFDEKTLKPTYRLRYNKIGHSYAMEVIKNLSLPHEVIKTAEEFYRHHETNFSKLEKELERKIREFDKELEKTRKREEEYRKLKEELKRELETKKMELEKEKEEAQRSYSALLEQIKRQISELQKDKNIPKAHRTLSMLKKDARRLFGEKQVAENSGDFRKGDSVRFMGMKGYIAEIKPGGRAIVEIGGKAVELPVSQLEKTVDKKENRIRVKVSPQKERLEINLIGKRRDEAELELLRFLDTVITTSTESVRIIHGIGSGIIREMVRDVLKNHPYVKSFRPAPPAEGGDGATIAELK